MTDEHSEFPFIDLTDSPLEGESARPATPSLAVALKHEPGHKQAPKIVASGRGAVAEQILQLAFAHGVKVREDADLVTLLSHLEIDSPIPLEAYAAVAEILAYVYKANAGYKGSTKNG